MVYERDLRVSFPAAELKPLRIIRRMLDDGLYRPWCLFDGEKIIGECFCGWESLAGPCWSYLCVSPAYRNGGTGALILEKMRERERDTVILGESELPRFAPDPAMAERRLGFYARNGARTAGYDTEMFGVPYKTLYWSDEPLPDQQVMEAHRAIYLSRFSPEKYANTSVFPGSRTQSPCLSGLERVRR
mgnify:CR=1 FL=1